MSGIRVDFSDGRPSLLSHEEATAALASIGAGIWPIDFREAPSRILTLLAQPALSESEVGEVERHFLLSRERLLRVVADAGRKPRVPGGGSLETFVVSHGYGYPQLYVVEEGIDYTRFDRFHINTTEDGVGVDEVLQLLWGGGLTVVQKLEGGVILTMEVSCPEPGRGWIVTYDGGLMHMGRLSTATPGTKALVQVFGPREWSIRYEGDVESPRRS